MVTIRAKLSRDIDPTVCVTGAGVGVDSAWRQKTLEAGKMPVNRGDSHPSAARGVGQVLQDDFEFELDAFIIYGLCV